MTTGRSTDPGHEPAPKSAVRPIQDNRFECGTLLLATVATLTLFVARLESARSIALLFVSVAASILVPWSVWSLIRKGRLWGRRFLEYAPVVIAAWTLWPPVAEVLGRLTGFGEASEVLMLTTLQNAALIVAAYSHIRRCQQLACLISSFLTLYVLVISSQPLVFLLAGIFGVMTLWWLMVRYWERVSNTYASSRSDRCLPVRSSVLAGIVAALILFAAVLGTTGGSTYVLGGFMPTSGGNAWDDEYARSGVGDGDAMVAAQEDAMSFGPVESDLFLESDMPSLYDMFNEAYGEPLPPPKKREQAKGLSPGNLKETEQRIARTQRSGREFSAVRRKVGRKEGTLEDRDAPALLHVVGRVPVHLALDRFDTFDGRTWTHSGAETRYPRLTLQTYDAKPWIQVQPPADFAIQGGTETHGIKLINLKTKRIPSPPQLSAIHIDEIDLVHFFGWSTDGVVEMPQRDQIPQLTVLYTKSSAVNLTPLRRSDFTSRFPQVRPEAPGKQRSVVNDDAHTIRRHLAMPPGDSGVMELGTEWTSGIPRGWRQVEAVVSRLRTEFTHDPEATAPADCPDVVQYFLQARRGPDYLFATTAAVMLRSLGYPARLVSGFYADPQDYDRAGGQTLVSSDDVHTWAEVGVGGTHWVAIEPTPGYEPPPETLTWRQQLALLWSNALAWTSQHSVTLAVIGVVLAGLWYKRLVWCDWVFMLTFWIAGLGDPVRRIRSTLRLLECRAWMAGSPRPATATVRQWYCERPVSLTDESRHQLLALVSIAERALYAPATLQAVDRNQTVQTCRTAMLHLRTAELRTWTRQGDLH